MSRRRYNAGSTNACSHLQTVDNDREGECVCTECGLVLESLYTATYEDMHMSATSYTADSNIYSFVSDICHNGCMPEGVITYAMNYYRKLCTKLRKQFPERNIAAYAVYETLNRFEATRTAEEIEHFSGVKIRDIWLIESNISTDAALNDPTGYVQRYASLLGLKYCHQLFIKEVIVLMENSLNIGNIKANCLVAVTIYLASKELGEKLMLKKICEVCDISTTSVHRVLRKLEQECRLNIEKTPELRWIQAHLRQ